MTRTVKLIAIVGAVLLRASKTIDKVRVFKVVS